jgi:hypothetical protein
MYNQHYTKWGKTESISSNVQNGTRVSTIITLIPLVLESLARMIRQAKETKGMQIV